MILRWGTGILGIAACALLLGAAPCYGQAQAGAPPAATTVAAPIVAVRIVKEDGHVLAESPTGIAVEIGNPRIAIRLQRAFAHSMELAITPI